jgi:hypothetical protein
MFFINLFIMNLKDVDVGCHIDGVFFGCLLYADDIILISPSIMGLQNMLTSVIILVLFYPSILTVTECHCLCIGSLDIINFVLHP